MTEDAGKRLQFVIGEAHHAMAKYANSFAGGARVSKEVFYNATQELRKTVEKECKGEEGRVLGIMLKALHDSLPRIPLSPHSALLKAGFQGALAAVNAPLHSPEILQSHGRSSASAGAQNMLKNIKRPPLRRGSLLPQQNTDWALQSCVIEAVMKEAKRIGLDTNVPNDSGWRAHYITQQVIDSIGQYICKASTDSTGVSNLMPHLQKQYDEYCKLPARLINNTKSKLFAVGYRAAMHYCEQELQSQRALGGLRSVGGRAQVATPIR